MFVLMEKPLLFADVILPLAIPNLFTYSVPAELQNKIKIGQRVVVQFGKKKLYTALVRALHTNQPTDYTTKSIESILDTTPIVNETQFNLWKWIADYYMCTLGEVMNAALPSSLKLSSETKLILKEKYETDNLSNDEFRIIETLENDKVLTMSDVEEVLSGKSAHSIIKSLLEKNIILIYEEIKEKYQPKIEEFVRFTAYASDEKNLKVIFDELEKRAFKQLEMVMDFIHLKEKNKEIKKIELQKRNDASAALINTLVNKNIFEVYKKETGRFASESSTAIGKALSKEQLNAYSKIKAEWADKEVTLLHGITSSGKTEIYVKLIEETLMQGKQVLYLLPEIAITTQVVSRIKKYFGKQLGVYHSKYNENERVEIWNEILKFNENNSSENKFNLILGARSALFLPYSNLGLIIVDEEHDSSFKQFDPAPRYNARDAAIVLANFHNAKVLLGSATPSIESYYNAENKKYGFAELTTRYGGTQLPEILIADIKEEKKLKKMKSHFSVLLMENIEAALNNKEQVIIFQNRRGFAPHLECKTCGWIPHCKNCDVSLVYHKVTTQLRCHYCGYTTPVPSTCNACGSLDILMKNFGTEKIEEELQLFFPEARIARMDYDSTRAKHSHQKIINDFEEHNIEILVGTQMVAKGLDFENVSTVGILSADQSMNFPHFRSHEKSFQLLTQVAGRSGRKNKRGKVIIQTYSPSHPIITYVKENNYTKMYEEEILNRNNFKYPPFYRIIELTVSDKDIDKVNACAGEFAEQLKSVFSNRVLGPEFALIPRIKNLYYKKILIKIAANESNIKSKIKIQDIIQELQRSPAYQSVKIYADVDPA